MRITPSVRFEKRPWQQHEGTARTDESKALKNWQMRMMERKKQQGYISSKCQENMSGSEVIKLFSCSTQLNIKFILLINVKMPTIVGILTFVSMINTTSERLKTRNFFICRYFSVYEQLKFCAQLS